ncbi:hypothetical protein LPLAFNJD_LOCUS1787 [Methylorubrum aminovorans]
MTISRRRFLALLSTTTIAVAAQHTCAAGLIVPSQRAIGSPGPGPGTAVREQLDLGGKLATPEMFGAKGNGADDTEALQALIDSGMPALINGVYTLSRRLTASENLNLIGSGRNRSKLIWTADAVSSGLSGTFSLAQAFARIEGISFQTQQIGSGTAILLDFSANLSTQNVGIEERCILRDNDIRGLSGRTQGWEYGIDIVSPLNVRVEGNYILGCWTKSVIAPSTKIGIRLRRGHSGDPALAYIDRNTVITCQDGCVSTDVEGVTLTRNDFEACNRSLTCQNIIRRRTQVRVENNHLGATYESLRLFGVHHFKLIGNEFFRLDNDPAKPVNMVVVENSAFGIIEANTLRNRSATSPTDGIAFIHSEGQLGVTVIESNIFFQCREQIIVPPQAMLVKITDSNIFYNAQGKTNNDVK